MKTIDLETARWGLARIWFPVAGLILLILIGQSFGGVYGGDLQRLWGWALPNFIPTLGLMLSVFAADALAPPGSSNFKVRVTFYKLAVGLSVFYLAVLTISILSPPLVNYLRDPTDAVEPIALLETSNFWLGPIQGLVVVSMGILFFLKEASPRTP